MAGVIRLKYTTDRQPEGFTVNPYAPANEADACSKRPEWMVYWNCLVMLAIAGVLALSVFIVNSHYSRLVGADAARPDAWLVFATQSANDGMIFVGAILFLVSLTTFLLHRHAWATRAVAILTCLLISLDLGLLRYRLAFEHADRAMVFAGLMSTMIVFGCGVPRFAGILLGYMTGSKTTANNG
jgi:hypothetical protein